MSWAANSQVKVAGRRALWQEATGGAGGTCVCAGGLAGCWQRLKSPVVLSALLLTAKLYCPAQEATQDCAWSRQLYCTLTQRGC